MHSRPIVPRELLILYYLSGRKSLTYEEKKKLSSLYKGFQGELYFYKKIKEILGNSFIQLYDLSLPVDDTIIQIDQLFIFQDHLLFHEVKHYSGDIIINEDRWYLSYDHKDSVEIYNPYIQLKRTETYLRRILREKNIPLKVSGRLVFTHNALVVFGLKHSSPVVQHNQLKRYLTSFQNEGRPDKKLKEYAKRLTDLHINDHKFETVPSINYDELRKGIDCPYCLSQSKRISQRRIQCIRCRRVQSNKNALTFSKYQLATLFPKENLALSLLDDWTGKCFSYKTLQTHLLRKRA